jgi:ATP-dependent DNA helicase RecG
VFKNRIEISNPGRFPEGLTPQDFIKGKHESVLRNPLVAEVLYKSKEIEHWGSGLKRIYDECRASKVKVTFEMRKTGFQVTFYRPVRTEKALRGTQKTTQKIVDLIRQNPSITRKEMAQHVGITEDGIKYHLSILQRKNAIRRVGPDKGGHWEIQGK